MSHGIVVRIGTAYGIELMPLKSTSANRGIGILIHGSKDFFDTHGLVGLFSGVRVFMCGLRVRVPPSRHTDFGFRRPGSHLDSLG